MKLSFTPVALALALLHPMQAWSNPMVDSHFATAVNICINFGSDNWFVTDRLEGAGWYPSQDAYYGQTIYNSPDAKVIVLPPPNDTVYPVRCSVISGEVKMEYAQFVVKSILKSTGTKEKKGTYEGCPAFSTTLDQVISIHSDGNELLCNDPNSAVVDVISRSNPAGGQ